MKRKKLRPYQKEIIKAVMDYLFSKSGNPVAASPGGTGKSLTMNALIKEMVTGWPGTRVMSLVHDAKVIDQNANSMVDYWPEADVGIYSAGLKQYDTTQDVIFAGIQSVAKRPEEFGKVHVVFIDECDLVSPKEETMYQKFLEALWEVHPKMRVIGFTATPYRLGMGCLTNLDLWDELCIDLTKTDRFNWFIENGFLSPLVTKKTSVEIDITNISMKGGDFDEKQMQEVADTDELVRGVVEECIRYGSDRKHWLVFSSGVKHGDHLARMFNAFGVAAVNLHGKQTTAYRDEQEALFRSGEIRVLINCGLYGRGWDFPELDMIAWARSTQSVALWVQGNVRLTRTAPGKLNGLVLDFGGNTRRLGPVNDPVVPLPRRKGDAVKGEAPVKECPECFSYVHTRIMVCPDCGYEFPPPKTIKDKADTADILKGKKQDEEPLIEDFYVRDISYNTKLSTNNNYYLRVTYGVGTYTFKEHLMFDSDNKVTQRRLADWWTYRGGKLPVPDGTGEAAKRTGELKSPTVIRVNVAKKHPEVIGCDFEIDAKTSDDIKVYDEIEKEEVYDDDDIPF